jgi:hypothetical protein
LRSFLVFLPSFHFVFMVNPEREREMTTRVVDPRDVAVCIEATTLIKDIRGTAIRIIGRMQTGNYAWTSKKSPARCLKVAAKLRVFLDEIDATMQNIHSTGKDLQPTDMIAAYMTLTVHMAAALHSALSTWGP